MECQKCLSDPEFFCTCSNIFICLTHLSYHCSLPGPHVFENLITDNDLQRNQKFKEELASRIKYLESLKSEIQTETKSLISKINQNTQSLLSNINKLLKDLIMKISRKKYCKNEFDEIQKTINTKMIIKQYDLNTANEAIQKCFSAQRFYDLVSIKPKSNLEMIKFLEKRNSEFKCIIVTHDGKELIAGSSDSSIRFWNTETKELIACLVHHKATVNCLAISLNCLYLASGSKDKRIILWDIEKKSVLNVFKGHFGAVNLVCFSCDSSMMVSGSNTGEIISWRLDTYEMIIKLFTYGSINCGVLTSWNFLLVGVGAFLQNFDLIIGQPHLPAPIHTSRITSIFLSKSERFLLTSSQDTHIKVWNPSTMLPIILLQGHLTPITSVIMTPNDKSIISGSCDCSILIWSTETYQVVHSFKSHSHWIRGFSYCNDILYSASDDCKIGLFNLSNYQSSSYLHSSPFTPNTLSIKNSIAVYGQGHNLIVSEVDSEENLVVLKGHASWIIATCISSNMKFALSSSYDCSCNLILWDLESFTLAKVLPGHNESVLCVDIADNEKKAVSGDRLGTVVVWNLISFEMEFKFDFGGVEVLAVKLTGSSKFLGVALKVFKFCVIDVERKVVIVEFDGLLRNVEKVLNTCDDKYFVTVNRIDGFKVWDIEKKCLDCEFGGIDQGLEWLWKYQGLAETLTKYVF